MDPWNICHALVADVRKMEGGDELPDALAAGVVRGVEHARPGPMRLPDRCRWWAVKYGFRVAFDGGRALLLARSPRESSLVGGWDGAAAVDEFGHDL